MPTLFTSSSHQQGAKDEATSDMLQRKRRDFFLLRGNEGHLVGPRLAQGQTRYGILLDPIFSQWAFKLQASVGEY